MNRSILTAASLANSIVDAAKAMCSKGVLPMVGIGVGLFLAGCAAGSSALGPIRQSSAITDSTLKAYAHSDQLLYVTNSTSRSSSVTVYHVASPNPKPVATIDIPGIVAGDCLDAAGTLYVMSSKRQKFSVTEYLTGKTTPYRTITRGLSDPAFCAVDKEGNLWLSNSGSGNVSEYPKGSSSPSVVLKGLSSPTGLAFDQSGDLLVANGGSTVLIFPPGATTPSNWADIDIEGAMGIAVDRKGTLYVADAGANQVVEFLLSNVFSNLQVVYKVIPSLSYPTAVTVNESGHLYVAEYQSNKILEFDPGTTKPLKAAITQGVHHPEGMAYSPPLLPRK